MVGITRSEVIFTNGAYQLQEHQISKIHRPKGTIKNPIDKIDFHVSVSLRVLDPDLEIPLREKYSWQLTWFDVEMFQLFWPDRWIQVGNTWQH